MSDWRVLTKDEISIIYEIDKGDFNIQSHEVNFINDVMKKIESAGDRAEFSPKQIAWINKLAEKYLD